ncbi:MAG: 2-amino-4-hydroxy-6-hydroxymethyldihydropteridine diphosphokinase [Bacteroidetes bacterium]|nr:2-amino-4-hydroxy-6-hydroxymethyldihydropteridine diphosphokinase [Bacteroidota bacterium]MBS1632062.1 2-amino-4-hydroxy-6-hydroxymethyldihydropteridine diphosphokinase [Bacteroidota bacterium]
MNKAYLLSGTNQGNRSENLKTAKRLIRKECGIIKKESSVYETAAWGKTDQPSFLNQALEIFTPLNAEELLQCILEIEKRMGRIRKEKYGARIIDIDILFYNYEIINLPELKIPHPEIQNRKFALIPLAEIAPGLMHPVLNKSIREILSGCPDPLAVKKYS